MPQKTKIKRSYRNRLESQKNTRQAILFTFLSLILILCLIFIGIPLLTKFTVFIGNIKSSTQPLSHTDLVLPAPPVLKTEKTYTNNQSLTIQGFSEPGSTVKIYLNSKMSDQVISSNNGSFTSNIPLKENKNEIYAIAIDSENNQSKPSEKIVIFYDTTPPKIQITNPPSENITVANKENQLYTISGQTEPGLRVFINERWTTSDYLGNFQITYKLNKGKNDINVSVSDKAGNNSQKSLTIEYSE